MKCYLKARLPVETTTLEEVSSTTEPTTVGPTTEQTTDGPTTEQTTDSPATEPTTDGPTTEATTDGPTTAQVTHDPTDAPTTIPESTTTEDLSTQCGYAPNAAPQIYGGNNATQHEWPWMTHVTKHNSGNSYGSCGGTIISARTILTAAHCVWDDNTDAVADVSKMEVHTECHLSRFRLGNTCITYDTESIIVPNGFHMSNFTFNDIALIITDAPIALSLDKAWPICLPGPGSVRPPNGTEMTVTGWGIPEFGERTHPILKEAVVQTVGDQECDRQYSGPHSDSIICVTGITGATCSGDSGGPLLTQDERGLWVQYGLTSFGALGKCGVNEGNDGSDLFEGYTETTDDNNIMMATWIRDNMVM